MTDTDASQPSSSTAGHWNEVYRSRLVHEVSWYEPRSETSLRLLTDTTLARDDLGSVIDIGAGASVLVDGLLGAGRRDITVLDVSKEALAVTRQRLGTHLASVTYIVSDVLAWRPDRSYDAWHDRAVLHFLSTEADRRTYIRLAADTVTPGGILVLGGFAPGGPTHCSGLPTAHRTADQIAAEFAAEFSPERAETEIHRTPTGAEQSFTWVRLRRAGAPDLPPDLSSPRRRPQRT